MSYSVYERYPVFLIYWVALKSNYVCLKDWADDMRDKSFAKRTPYKEAIDIIDKYWTGETNGSILR